MKVNKLPVGTKLMWDARVSNLDVFDNSLVYPAIVIEQHHNKQWVKIKTTNNASWVGPYQDYLRLPTQEELDTLTWPGFE